MSRQRTGSVSARLFFHVGVGPTTRTRRDPTPSQSPVSASRTDRHTPIPRPNLCYPSVSVGTGVGVLRGEVPVSTNVWDERVGGRPVYSSILGL